MALTGVSGELQSRPLELRPEVPAPVPAPCHQSSLLPETQALPLALIVTFSSEQQLLCPVSILPRVIPQSQAVRDEQEPGGPTFAHFGAPRLWHLIWEEGVRVPGGAESQCLLKLRGGEPSRASLCRVPVGGGAGLCPPAHTTQGSHELGGR